MWGACCPWARTRVLVGVNIPVSAAMFPLEGGGLDAAPGMKPLEVGKVKGWKNCRDEFIDIATGEAYLYL